MDLDFGSWFVGYVVGFVCCEVAVLVGLWLNRKKRGRPVSVSSRGYRAFMNAGRALIGR